MSHPYDTGYALPFPSFPLKIRQVEGSRTTDTVPALVDTGADGTLVPADLLASIGAEEIYSTRIRSHWGEWRPVNIYLVDLEIEGASFSAIEVIADTTMGDTVLLGRNVLNKLILLLDGPHQQTDVLFQRPRRF